MLKFLRKSASDTKEHRQFTVCSVKAPDFHKNRVNTARYSFLSFLPLFLYDQFSRLANLYFLVIGLMEQIPGVSPIGRWITLVPLTLILSVSAVKEIVEDLKRRSSDKNINSIYCEVFTHRWLRTTWGELRVGDIVRVVSGHVFPADIILIATSEANQACYIQTASLDGETNYKLKHCKPECQDYKNEDYWISTKATVHCDGPNSNLYKFNGTIQFNDEKPFPIDFEQMVLRGSQLKNTHWAIGIVTYTGHDTKIMLNTSQVVIKRSTIDQSTNLLVISLIAVLLLLTLGSAVAYELHLRNVAVNHWYLGLSDKLGFTVLFTCITFFILYHNIIPISLMVTLEIIKFIQAYLITHDPQLRNSTTQAQAVVNTSGIIEELGLINYIFSDKTGTLTCNEMELRQISVGSHVFVLDRDTIGLNHALSRIDAFSFRMFIINLLVCNSVVPEYGTKPDDVAYQSTSPDETAIVSALADCGYRFVERVLGSITIDFNGVFETWKVLTAVEFTSTRKRMSVLVQSPENEYFLMVKGADSVIFERLKEREDPSVDVTFAHLEEFARSGLRTLCIAYKSVSIEECQAVQEAFAAAFSSIGSVEAEMGAVAEVFENDLTLLGATGIEDKLQQRVPETIDALRSAGIRIWMLTGDKLETALNVAYSCRLLTTSMDVRVLNCSSVENCIEKLTTVKKDKQIPSTLPDNVRKSPDVPRELALVVTGQDLAFALDPECLELFLDVAIYCESVICSRVSPLQKNNILSIVRDKVADITTLAIGDGANDCSMIRAANVGVGIFGREGMEAANAADFGISDFNQILRLLFVYGAASCRRICNCTFFFFYKNIVFNFIPFFFDFFNMFSGQVIFSKVHMAMYNVFYTSLPPFCFGLLDQSCSLEAQYNLPYLYQSLRRSSPFGIKRFFYWMLNGILHSFLVFFLSYAICYHGVISPDGSPMSMGLFGNIVFTYTLLVVTLKAALELRFWFWMTHLGVCGGALAYIICLTLFSRKVHYIIWFEPEFLDTDILMYQTPLFWLGLGVPIIVLLPDFFFHCIRNTWFTPSYLLVTELERQKQIDWTEPEHIKNVQSELDRSSEIKTRRTKKYFGFAFSITENRNFKMLFPVFPFRPKQPSDESLLSKI